MIPQSNEYITSLALAIKQLTVSTNFMLAIMPGAGQGCKPGLVQILVLLPVSVKQYFCWLSQGCQVRIMPLMLAVVESTM